MTTLQSGGAPLAINADGGVWLSISDLAKRKGISRQSAKERVDRLVEKGLVETRTEGRSRMVELAAYDRAVGQSGDVHKEASAETKRIEDASASPRLRDAQTERAQYEARLKLLDLAERQGNILPLKGEHGIEEAITASGIAIARELERFMNCAEDLAAAVAKDGVNGARRVLKVAIHQARIRTAEVLSSIADEGKLAEASGPIETDIGDLFGEN